MEQNLWQQNVGTPPAVPETVTVTLTQSPGEDGSHVISRIETHLSDGTTQISTSLTPETAQLLARLNPSMFPIGSLVQLQNGAEGTTETEEPVRMDIGEPKLDSADTEPDPNINIQVSEAIDQSDGSIRILAGDHTEASNMITQENHSISNQNEELICVSMVPMVPAVDHSSIEDVLNHESSDEDL